MVRNANKAPREFSFLKIIDIYSSVTENGVSECRTRRTREKNFQTTRKEHGNKMEENGW